MHSPSWACLESTTCFYVFFFLSSSSPVSMYLVNICKLLQSVCVTFEFRRCKICQTLFAIIIVDTHPCDNWPQQTFLRKFFDFLEHICWYHVQMKGCVCKIKFWWISGAFLVLVCRGIKITAIFWVWRWEGNLLFFNQAMAFLRQMDLFFGRLNEEMKGVDSLALQLYP